jgi:two-component system sensor histidine kinase/response regulator
MKPTILCVDDEIDNLEALERLFRTKYKVLKADSGPHALKVLDQNPEPVAVILTDQRMPEMSGVQFLEKSIQKNPDAIRILLTGYTDIESIIGAINSGHIYRYLNKPWDPVDLLATVDQAVEKFSLTNELRIKNDQLSKALEDLKTLDSAKDKFMILINHELKTPLTSIINFTDLLKETRMNDEQIVCVSRIERSTTRLHALIDDVLLVVQSEAGVLKTQVAPFDCGNIKLQLTSDESSLTNQKNLRAVLRWVDKKIVADQKLIQQVFNRLIHNSIKFANENTQILIRAELIETHMVKFSIFNQGPTISANVIHKIMTPFFLDEDVMKHSTGIGLGLSICQSILKSHSSKLVINNESEGVEVSFELPCL